jgi:hypothetical protein
MWMNLDQLPAGKSMYTIAVTSDPVDTPREDVCYDEIDVVARRGATITDVVEAAREEIARDYADCRVIGVSDQSDGYVMWQDPAGDWLAKLEESDDEPDWERETYNRALQEEQLGRPLFPNEY